MTDEPTLEAIDAAAIEKEETRKALLKEAIEIGLKVDKRWSNDKLLEMIGNKRTEEAQVQAVTQAKAQIKSATATDTVSARVLPMGNGKISKGIHIPGKGDLTYNTGDTLTTERTLAEGLQNKGFVEIQAHAAS
jgi:hypothetical protein